MARRLTAVSVDLDELWHYRAIHGLPVDDGEATGSPSLVYGLALERIASFARARGIPVTLFAVGADLTRADNAAALRRFAEDGHAVENHSLSHRYDLVRLGRARIADEIERGADAIERATGTRPKGFRAPGYTVTAELFDVLEELEVAFDSSVFPCPAYWSAKAIARAYMRARGRPSASILDTPRVLVAPAAPYRPGARFERRGARRFVELPIQVTPALRLPFIGTSIALAGAAGARALASMCAFEPFVNVELHAIDFLDASDGLTDLAPYQPELRRDLSARLDALSAALDGLVRRGHAFVRLDEAAAAFAAA